MAMDVATPRCFHCAEPLPHDPVHATVSDAAQAFCCHGCAAAAQFIADAGLGAYYRLREAPGNRPAAEDWSVYDRPALAAELVHQADGCNTATVQVEGLRCAACTWLIERALSELPGVTRVQVNPVAARVHLEWRAGALPFSTLLTRLAALGYRPHPGDHSGATTRRSERRRLLIRLAIAGLGSMQAMMYGGAQWLGSWADIPVAVRDYLSWVGLLVTAPVVAYSAQPFFLGAWRGLQARTLGMDASVALAILLAFGASVAATVAGTWPVYYDALSMFVFLLLAGRYLELAARQQAVERADALARLLPNTAMRLDASDQPLTVGRRELAPGDRVLVRHGEPVPSDATLESADARLDEALLSGESAPVAHRAGATLVGGALNAGDPFIARITRVGSATVLAGILRLLDRAQSERPPLALAAERVAGWFVAGVLVAAAVTYWLWQDLDPARALGVTLAVLVATCPCALGLATPAALTAATQALARRGLLVTRGTTLEALAQVTDVVFDKTGTLTLGQPTLVATEAADPDRALAIAAALERASEHPLARAFADIPTALSARDVRVTPGAGLAGDIDGVTYRLGRADWVTAATTDEAALVLAGPDGVLARFTVADPLRADAAASIAALRELGISPHLASGDAPDKVAACAATLGITDAAARLDPAAKLERVRALQAEGRVVLVVGDGVNDAPVLAGGDVAIAIEQGSALAQASADAVLLGGRLAPLIAGLETARATRRIVRQNLIWAVGYNLIALPVAMAGWMDPWLAALGMSLSSLLVVLNALRLAEAPHPLPPEGGRAARSDARGDA
jgi:Cu2+-exporting ATPase